MTGNYIPVKEVSVGKVVFCCVLNKQYLDMYTKYFCRENHRCAISVAKSWISGIFQWASVDKAGGKPVCIEHNSATPESSDERWLFVVLFDRIGDVQEEADV
jgi:hypothetical protein